MLWIPKFWLWTSVLALVGLAIGISGRHWMASRDSAARLLTLEPANVRIPSDTLEGDVLTIHYNLRNVSDRDLVVTGLPASCNCMQPIGPGGQPMATPFTLAEGEDVSLSLSIATVARVGPQRFYFGAARDGSAELSPVSATVECNIVAPLRAQPNVVIFRDAKPGVELKASIELADTLPDPGVELASVSSSRPEILRADLVSDAGSSSIFGDSPGKRRYRVDVSLTPDDAPGMRQESLTLAPTNSKYPPLTIPVYCRLASAPYELSPSGLTLVPGEAGAVIRRTVFCRFDEGQPPVLEVLSAPASVAVKISDFSEHVLKVELDCTSPDAGGELNQQVVFSAGRDKTELTFPIVFVDGRNVTSESTE